MTWFGRSRLVKFDEDQPRDEGGRWAKGAHVMTETDVTQGRHKIVSIHDDEAEAKAAHAKRLNNAYNKMTKAYEYGLGEEGGWGDERDALPRKFDDIPGTPEQKAAFAANVLNTHGESGGAPELHHVKLEGDTSKGGGIVSIVTAPRADNSTEIMSGHYNDPKGAEAKAEGHSRAHFDAEGATHDDQGHIPDDTVAAAVEAYNAKHPEKPLSEDGEHYLIPAESEGGTAGETIAEPVSYDDPFWKDLWAQKVAYPGLHERNKQQTEREHEGKDRTGVYKVTHFSSSKKSELDLRFL